MKKVFSFCLCITLLLMFAIPVSAAQQYQYIDTLQCSLNINSIGIATCSGTVETTLDNELEIEVTLRVYKNGDWEDLKTWTDRDVDWATAGGQYAVARGYRYQTYVTAYVYNENGHIVESSTITQDKYY